MSCAGSNMWCDTMCDGIIFDIKEFSIHDGPGARATVFLKGCPLRCLWCHNPEGLQSIPQLMVKEALCIHCGRCRYPCGHAECQPYGRCIHACANGCLTVAGRTVTAAQLAEQLRKLADFFAMTGGGITFSGGEPLQQSAFVCETADRLAGMHLALQTSGYADEDVYRRVIGKFDYIMQDIKLADEREHIRYTGVSNGKIRNNIAYLKRSGKEFVFRIPLIPGITDTEENLKGCSEIAGDCPVELLQYNPLAGAKYAMLGMRYALAVEKNRDAAYTDFFQNARLVR